MAQNRRLRHYGRRNIIMFNVKRILCPTDFSEYSKCALRYAAFLAKMSKATITVLHANELRLVPLAYSIVESDPSALEEYNNKITSCWHKNALPKWFRIYRLDGDIEPGNAIVRFAENRDVDLIVMSTHGSRGLRRAFFGSNTAEVARRAACPVLIITPPLHAIAFPTTV